MLIAFICEKKQYSIYQNMAGNLRAFLTLPIDKSENTFLYIHKKNLSKHIIYFNFIKTWLHVSIKIKLKYVMYFD
jgi:hypothetical protein